MKTIVPFAALICALCLLQTTTEAAPADLALWMPEDTQLLLNESALQTARQKRATCDLLSGLGFQHSACAAHCVLRGNRGGYCNGRAVCVCRN